MRRPVPARVDSAHSTDAVDAGRILFDGHALRDEGADGAAHLFVAATQKARPLSPSEHAAMETGQGDPLGLTARPAKSLECPFASPQVDDGSARRRVELLLQRLHAPNGEELFARKSTRRKPPKCLWRSETFSTVQGLLDTAASGLPNAPSAFAEGSVNGCGSRPDVGLRTNDAGNLRTGVPCSGSAAVRSRVTAADSLGGPIWTGHSRSPPPLLRRRPPGWLGAPYGARASLPFGATLRGSPAGAGGGLCPLRPPQRQRRMRGAGRDVWVKIRASEAERAEWHAKARSAGLTLSDLVRPPQRQRRIAGRWAGCAPGPWCTLRWNASGPASWRGSGRT